MDVTCRLLALVCLLASVPTARAATPAELDQAIGLARRTLAMVQRAAPRPEYARALDDLEGRARLGADAGQLITEVAALRRQIVLSHPALSFERLLITQRGLPVSHFTHQTDQYLGRHSQPGPGLIALENWKTQPRAVSLTGNRLPTGTVLNPDLSADGRHVLFAFCDASPLKLDSVLIPTHPKLIEMWPGYDADRTGRRRYFVYEADVDSGEVRQLTGTSRDRLETTDGRQTVMVEDMDPIYLPDGGIAFTSTRSQNFGRCHWGRYTPSFLLYRAEADGSRIQPLSYGEANEWAPSVLPDGRLLYTRWDYIDRHSVWYQSLWTTFPDGTGTAHYYGNYSANPCSIAEAKPIPGSPCVVATAAAHHYYTAGSLILIDPRQGEDGATPVKRLTPECGFPESEQWGQAGIYCNPWPISEDLFLCSYAPDKLTSGVWPANGAFGIYLVDSVGGRELIYRDPAVDSFNPMPLRPRAHPAVVPSRLPAAPADPHGTCYIRNVYDSRTAVPANTVKYVRINRILNQPTPSPGRRNSNDQQVVKGVIGTVPVEADGSVAFRAPSGEALQLQLLDADQAAVMTMRSLIYLQPGESLGCVGCHERHDRAPRVHATAESVPPRDPQPLPGARYAGGLSFGRSVQPVLDRWCVSCHGVGRTDGGVSLLGDRAYESLTQRPGMVTILGADNNSVTSAPRDFYAAAGKLMPLLAKGHAGITLPPDDLGVIAAWLDLNAMKYGDYSFNRVEDRHADPAGEQALRAYVGEQLGADWAKQPWPALVNAGQPDQSRVLRAPLAVAAGGWGQSPRYTSTDDPAWRRLRELVEASIAPLQWHDVDGTCGREPCICGSCWVRLAKLNQPAARQAGIAYRPR